jgi:hypothetical protein
MEPIITENKPVSGITIVQDENVGEFTQFINRKEQIKINIISGSIYVYTNVDAPVNKPFKIYTSNQKDEILKSLKKISNLNKDDMRDIETIFAELTDESEEPRSELNILLEYVEANMELFHDEIGEGYAVFKLNSSVLPIRGGEFRDILNVEYKNATQGCVSSRTMDDIIDTLDSMSRKEGVEHKLHNRICSYNEAFWFDCGNSKAVKITKEGWEIVSNPPIYFRQDKKHVAYDTTTFDKNGDAKLLLDFTQLKGDSEKQDVLFITHTISTFIPDIIWAASIFSGIRGSSKTTKSLMQKKLVDDCGKYCLMDLDKEKKNMRLMMVKNHMVVFDNMDRLNRSQSNLLCKAVTGGADSERMLYTNAEETLFSYKLVVGMTAIEMPVNQPDLLERCILITDKKPSVVESEAAFWIRFEENKGKIMGGIFNTISNAMSLIDDVKLEETPRMIDFTRWGCAISKALGYTQEDFLESYQISTDKLNEDLMDSNIFCTIIIKLMENIPEWTGNMASLLQQMRIIGKRLSIDEDLMPKAPNALSRKIHELSPLLIKKGIEIIETKNMHKDYIFTNKDCVKPLCGKCKEVLTWINAKDGEICSKCKM